MMLTVALFVFAVGGAKARTNVDMSAATASANATWTSGTNTFAWTAENEYIVIPGLSGDLTGCYLDFTISDQCHLDIVDTDDNVKEGGWSGYGRFGSGGSKTQDLSFMVSGSSCDITKVKEVRICSQSASGSLTVTAVSYYFPLKLNFNANGVATVPFNSITTSGGVTFDPFTGVVTNTDGTGYLAIELPSAGIDLSTIKRIDVTYTGDDSNPWADSRVLHSLYIHDNTTGDVNTWQGSRYGVNFTSYAPNSSKIDIIRFNAGTLTNGTITISEIKFTSEFVSCAKAGETVLNTLPWNKIDDSGTETPAWNMNGASDTYYGNDSGDATHYADLTEYSELRVYCNSNEDGFRAFFIKADGSGTNEVLTTAATWNESDKYYSLNLSAIDKYDDKIALKSIKSDLSWKGGKVGKNVTNIVVYKVPAAGSAQYLITGKGLLDAATTTMLANENVTSIDVTGMTNVTATTLTSVNPNCLFIANSGKLSNTKNVIVSGTCANLELTDGKPFKAPAAFTATAAKFTKEVTDAEYATMVIPFAANLPSGVTAKNLTGVSGTTITTTDAATLAANQPVLIHADAGNYDFTATDASIAATGDGLVTNGLLNASYSGTTAAVNDRNYVLQNSAEYGVNFYQVKGTAATMLPFRAYLVTPTTEAPVLFLDFGNEVTGINDVRSKMADVRGEVYNLNGQRVTQPSKGLYIVNGKKVVIK